MSVVEIRTLKLKPGAARDFDRLYSEEALPLLQKWNFDVVAHGRSHHDSDAYYVVRAFKDLRHGRGRRTPITNPTTGVMARARQCWR
jgi:hypothetical protein